MKIYKHKSYQEYVDAQTLTNKIKLNWVYAREHAIKSICNQKQNADFIICHGTRNGAEQKYFKQFLPEAYVIGTEISETANQFEMTIQHDFTFPVKDWIGKADIVYTNSFDHSMDPEKTIQTWKEQLKPTGAIYIEYNEGQSVCEPADCLEATQREVENLILRNGLNIKDKLSGSQGSIILVCERENND
jgi:hypothetical protein